METEDDDVDVYLPRRRTRRRKTGNWIWRAVLDTCANGCFSGFAFSKIVDEVSVSKILLRFSFTLIQLFLKFAAIYAIGNVASTSDSIWVEYTGAAFIMLGMESLFRGGVSMNDTQTRVRKTALVYLCIGTRATRAWVLEHHTPFLYWLAALFTNIGFVVRWMDTDDHIARSTLYIVGAYGLSTFAYFFYERPDLHHLHCTHFFENVYRFSDYHQSRNQLTFLCVFAIANERVYFGTAPESSSVNPTASTASVTLGVAGFALASLSML